LLQETYSAGPSRRSELEKPMREFCALVLTVATLGIFSCVAAPIPDSSSPDRSQTGSAAESERDVSSLHGNDTSQVVELPFRLTIGGIAVGPDRKVNIPESQGAVIQLTGNSGMNGQAKVVDASGMTVLLGAWQAASAQFYYRFPYGENHLVLTIDNVEYDIHVVTGAPEPTVSTVGCEGGYLDLNPDAKWEYEENREGEYTLYWTYSVGDWKALESGEVSLKILTEGASGVERRLERSAVLELVCRDGTVFINGAVETDQQSQSVTTYDDNTVYIPAEIHEGLWWQRQGILEISRTDGDTAMYNITEKFTYVGQEHVNVKAGEFEADRIDYEIERSGQDGEFKYVGASWYVPGVGRILSEAELEGSPRMELVSFERVTAQEMVKE